MGSRGVLAAVIAAIMLSLSLAAVASAEAPKWIECAKEKGGPYEKGCTKEGGAGGFSLKPGIGKGKALRGVGTKLIWHTVIPGKGDMEVECASEKLAGAVAAPNKVNSVVIELKKCKVLESPCKTEGGALETITTNDLSGELGYLNTAHTAIGISLTAEAAGGYIATFECEGFTKARWSGAIIGAYSPFGFVTKESSWIYAVSEYGIGQPNSLSNPPAFEEGADPVGVLGTEFNGPETGNTWQPGGGLASGWEGTFVNKGEALAAG